MWDEDKYQKSMTPEAIAYREGFEAGAKAMRDKCIGIADDEDPTGIIVREINRIVLPTPTTKGGA